VLVAAQFEYCGHVLRARGKEPQGLIVVAVRYGVERLFQDCLMLLFVHNTIIPFITMANLLRHSRASLSGIQDICSRRRGKILDSGWNHAGMTLMVLEVNDESAVFWTLSETIRQINEITFRQK
jgi:hypothetical protein